MKKEGPGCAQIIHFDTDIAESRKNGSHVDGDFPAETYDELVAEAEQFLSGREPESAERIRELMAELRTAVLVNNDPRASSLLSEFEKRFRTEVVE